MRGRLIVVEGLDGTGKSTCSKALAARLGAEWTTTPGAEVRAIREQVDDSLGTSRLARQLAYASFVAAESTRIAAKLASGRDVVVDRYWATTVAYAGLDPDYVDLTAVESRLVPADVTWFLTLDEAERQRRLRARGMSAADEETLDTARRRRLTELYREALKRPVCGRVVEVDVTGLREGELWEGWAA